MICRINLIPLRKNGNTPREATTIWLCFSCKACRNKQFLFLYGWYYCPTVEIYEENRDEIEEIIFISYMTEDEK